MKDRDKKTVEDHLAELQGRPRPRKVLLEEATPDDHLAAKRGEIELVTDPADLTEDDSDESPEFGSVEHYLRQIQAKNRGQH